MFKSDVEAADAFIKKYQLLKSEISKVIIGQDVVLDQILISVFSKGHCLLVGVPGLAKTLMVSSVAEALGLKFNRIQIANPIFISFVLGSIDADPHE